MSDAQNAAAMTKLQRMMHVLVELDDFDETVAPAVARVVRHYLIRNIAAGVTPEGKKWKPTLEGEQALQGAGAHLHVEVVGSSVRARLDEIEARHDRGWVKGGRQRQILPTKRKPIPDEMQRGIEEALQREFEKATAL